MRVVNVADFFRPLRGLVFAARKTKVGLFLPRGAIGALDLSISFVLLSFAYMPLIPWNHRIDYAINANTTLIVPITNPR